MIAVVDPRFNSILDPEDISRIQADVQGECLRNGFEVETFESIAERNGSSKECQDCHEKKAFFDWPFCWECGEKHIEDSEIKQYWERLANYAPDRNTWQNLCFDEGKFVFQTKQKIDNKIFKNCSFVDVLFENVEFVDCEFDGVNFTGATFLNCAFKKTSFISSSLLFVKFDKTIFQNSVLSKIGLAQTLFGPGTVVYGGRFENSVFSNVAFFGRKTRVAGTNIEKIQFSNCDLSHCDLTHASLKAVTVFQSNVNGMSVQLSQKKEVCFNDDCDRDVRFTLLPTWSIAKPFSKSFREDIEIRSICNGLESFVGLLLSCISASTFLGLIFCLIYKVFGGLFSFEPFLRVFLWSFAILLSVGTYAFWQIQKDYKNQDRNAYLTGNAYPIELKL
jgi:uncharacterized protein YjbI with pentapeptide repeats